MINPNTLRKTVLKMVYEKGSGHIGGSFSLAELIAVLFDRYDFKNTNKLILSKGHAVPIVYAAFHEIGALSSLDLATFREVNSMLQGHPDMVRCPYMHATTGSLGQGLSIAIGHALGMRLKKEPGKVFCIIGDGEVQEGQMYEAFRVAGELELANLVCILDNNGYQSDSKTPDYHYLHDLLYSHGWFTAYCDGHNIADINKQLDLAAIPECTAPKYLHLDTIKGKGVSFMEGGEWHSRVPTKEEYELAMKELG